MTILEAKGLLFLFFVRNNAFNIKDNFKNIVLVSSNPELDQSIILLALEDLIKQDIVRQSGDWFILVQPLGNYTQNVLVSKPTVEAICEIMNELATQYKNDELLVDPLNLKERDIQNLIIIVQNTLKK